MAEIVRFDIDYMSDEMPVEREAKLFEAGDYPDRGITITEDDLDEVVKNFRLAPVMVEHTATPLDPLGVVKTVWRRGRDLFGRLAFPQEIGDFLEKRGIRKLSAGLIREPLSLAEVSIVVSPRVSDAALFNKIKHTLEVEDVMKSEITEYQQMQTEINDLRFAMKRKEVDERLAALKAEGKIVPAAEAYAREILLKGDGKISFADSILTVSELFERFLDAQPHVAAFGELAGSSLKSSEPILSAEDEEMIGRLGISREQLAHHIR